MIRTLALASISAVFLSACQKDETVTAYGGADKLWRLHTLDGQAFAALATLRFPEAGRIMGQGPCNAFSASQTAPYPWFATGPLAATKRACPDLSAESAYFTALQEMTQVEILDDTMLLSNDAGREMLFKSGI
jgi:heat shock protein HslJ